MGSHQVSNTPPVTLFPKLYEGVDPKSIKVAAFDMDDTLICTKSGIKFGRGAHDWKWRNNNIVPVLRKRVHEAKYVMVIFTNQRSVSVTPAIKSTSKSFKVLSTKVDLIFKDLQQHFELQPLVFAACGRPGKAHGTRSSEEQHLHSRKPETGMWESLEKYFERVYGEEFKVDLENSFFVGDAAGRDGDHLGDDINFAANVGLPFYTPEDFFGA